MIDLHVHSTFSDGSLTPGELVALARKEGLTGMALTDHDNTDGHAEFFAACDEHGIEGVPGVEISVECNSGSMHMLGYYVDRANAPLEEALARTRGGREERNVKIMALLKEAGASIEWEDVRQHAGEEVVGRPHFAKAMVEAGFVKTFREAFDLYLAWGKSAYADRFRLPPSEGLKLIAGSGGIPVLAHPYTVKLEPEELRDVVGELVAGGLKGIEVYYPEHRTKRRRQYLELCAEFDLIATGGTDFHGDLNPKVRLARGHGSLKIPDGVLPELRAAAARR